MFNYIIAASIVQFQTMQAELASILWQELRLKLKPASLEWMLNRHAVSSYNASHRGGIPAVFTRVDADTVLPWEQRDAVWGTIEEPTELPQTASFTRVECLEVLGILVSPDGCTDRAVEHRIQKADHHWQDRRKELQDKRFPFRERLRRFYTTVVATLLWGSGEWKLTKRLAGMLQTWEHARLRSICAVIPLAGETAAEYRQRSTRAAREKCKAFGIPSVLERVAVSLHKWVGTYSGAPDGTKLMTRVARTRGYRWWLTIQFLNTIGPAFRHTGRRFLYRFEDQLPRFAGEDWDTKSLDETIWKQLRKSFVQQAIKYWCGERYLRVYAAAPRSTYIASAADSNDKLALAMVSETNFFTRSPTMPLSDLLQRLQAESLPRPSVLLQGDNKAICHQLAGRYVMDLSLLPFEEVLSNMVRWDSLGISMQPGFSAYCFHRKREHNRTADALANRCLDTGYGHITWLYDGIHEVIQRLASGQQLDILGWFDGALRAGTHGAAGLHVEARIRGASDSTESFKILSEAFLFRVDSAYSAEFNAARQLVQRVSELIVPLTGGHGRLLDDLLQQLT